LKNISTILGMILALAVLAVALAGMYFLFRYIVDVFGTLEPQVKTLAAIASVVAVLCAVLVAGGLKARRASENETVPKANLYEELAAFWADQLTQEKAETAAQVDASKGVRLEQHLALYGSPKVITAYLQLRRSVSETGKEGNETAGLLTKLVQAMRADLGRKEQNIKEKDILELLLGNS